MNYAEIGGLFMMAASIVWGASAIKSETKHLRQSLDRVEKSLTAAVEAVVEKVDDHGTRIGRLEGRLGP